MHQVLQEHVGPVRGACLARFHVGTMKIRQVTEIHHVDLRDQHVTAPLRRRVPPKVDGGVIKVSAQPVVQHHGRAHGDLGLPDRFRARCELQPAILQGLAPRVQHHLR
eukprot:221646-Lingulodinium_polyedra.AAC.1